MGSHGTRARPSWTHVTSPSGTRVSQTPQTRASGSLRSAEIEHGKLGNSVHLFGSGEQSTLISFLSYTFYRL